MNSALDRSGLCYVVVVRPPFGSIGEVRERWAPQGKHQSVTAVTRGVQVPVSAFVLSQCRCDEIRKGRPLPYVTTKVVRIDQRPLSSLGPAIHRRRRRPDFETGARVACCSCADAGGRSGLRQRLRRERPGILLRGWSSTLVVEPARNLRGSPRIGQAGGLTARCS
jgi:hypothetical protein